MLLISHIFAITYFSWKPKANDFDTNVTKIFAITMATKIAIVPLAQKTLP